MGDAAVVSDEDDIISQSDPDDSDFDIGNQDGAVNAGGPAAVDSHGGNSSDDCLQTDLIVDNICVLVCAFCLLVGFVCVLRWLHRGPFTLCTALFCFLRLKSCFRSYKNQIAAGYHTSKRQKTHHIGHLPIRKNATNRGNMSWYSDLIGKILDDRKSVIERYGFPCFLHFNCSGVPRPFFQWIADHIHPESSDIILNSGVIHLSPTSISQIIGVVNSGLAVKGECEGVKEAFVSFMGLSEFPTIKHLGRLLLTSSFTDEQFFVGFMVVTMSSFLCPNSSTFPSTKYLGSLLVAHEVRDYNWASYAHIWFIESVKKYLRDKSKYRSSKSNLTLGGCSYVPAVQYLDFVDFGERTPANSLPRITVWKKDMIKEFAQLDHKDGYHYGLRNVKSLDKTCYGVPSNSPPVSSHLPAFIVALKRSFGDSLRSNMLLLISKIHLQVGRNYHKVLVKMWLSHLEVFLLLMRLRLTAVNIIHFLPTKLLAVLNLVIHKQLRKFLILITYKSRAIKEMMCRMRTLSW